MVAGLCGTYIIFLYEYKKLKHDHFHAFAYFGRLSTYLTYFFPELILSTVSFLKFKHLPEATCEFKEQQVNFK